MGELLARLGIGADVAVNGLEAVEILQVEAYDLVFMDCQMPTMNGYDATTRLRTVPGPNREVPVVAMTADVIDGSRGLAARSGMNDFVAKPVEVPELVRVLRAWLPAAA